MYETGKFGKSSKSVVFLLLAVLSLAGCQSVKDVEAESNVTLEQIAAEQGRKYSVEQANSDYLAGRFEAARAKYLRILVLSPDNGEARIGLGESLLALSEPKLAYQEFLKAQASPGMEGRALQGAGISLLATGRVNEAQSTLLRAAEADQNLWRVWNALGRTYDQQSRWDEAAAAYAKALEIDPQSSIVMNNQGMSFMLQRRFPEAEDRFAAALQSDPSSEIVRNNLRMALAWEARYYEAVAGVEPSKQADVLNNVGYIALLQGDLDVAEAFFAQAMDVSPSYHRAAADNLRLLDVVKQGQRANQTKQ